MNNIFLSYIDERNKRNLDQIIEMDEDALRYSMKKYAKEKSMKSIFFYFHDFDKDINEKNIIIRKRNLENFFYLMSLVSKSKIVYINVQGIKEFFIALISRILYPRIKLIFHFHGLFKMKENNFFKKLYYKTYIRLFDLIACDTDFEAEKVNVFMNRNIAYRFFYGSNLSVVKPIRHEKITLVFVGRISPEKTIEKIIDGLKNIKDKVKLIIIGNIENKDYYGFLVDKLKCMDYEFKDFMKKIEMQEIFKRSDALVNLRSDEAFGRVFVEALSSGLPVIGSYEAPGARELIKDGFNGLLIKEPKEIEKILNLNFKKMRNYCIENRLKYSYNESYKTFLSLMSKIENK